MAFPFIDDPFLDCPFLEDDDRNEFSDTLAVQHQSVQDEFLSQFSDFDVGGPTPTTAVQRGPSIPRDNELKNMRIYDIG
ncbi:hypothetical protein HBH99_257080, partial [Parastagonospora nodorum]